ncbi:hypothetical protein Sden_2069 [Shewanella denitrificans OS217]|uniref:Uncharacterized protein n=1 Tax=Shewanella denitrificans (strain OS217 / ATCC BAA-1090 / DSM 15013) TaxID=318161 RepID=Q12MH5_SHEDO|nr:hypothetical protein [Shewanella denitrificans]ABE55351.1 hypothetical protein Sden_2069 [Shewanella denitrificans OS217]
MESKVIYVKAYFKELVQKTEHRDFDDPWAKKNVSTSKNEYMPKFSENEVDSERLSRDIEIALAVLDKDGYALKEIVTVTSGKYAYDCGSISSSPIGLLGGGPMATEGTGGYGYGYSYTDSVIIVGQK